MLAEAILVHGVKVINFVDYSRLRTKIKEHQLDTNQMAPLSRTIERT